MIYLYINTYNPGVITRTPVFFFPLPTPPCACPPFQQTWQSILREAERIMAGVWADLHRALERPLGAAAPEDIERSMRMLLTLRDALFRTAGDGPRPAVPLELQGDPLEAFLDRQKEHIVGELQATFRAFSAEMTALAVERERERVLELKRLEFQLGGARSAADAEKDKAGAAGPGAGPAGVASEDLALASLSAGGAGDAAVRRRYSKSDALRIKLAQDLAAILQQRIPALVTVAYGRLLPLVERYALEKEGESPEARTRVNAAVGLVVSFLRGAMTSILASFDGAVQGGLTFAPRLPEEDGNVQLRERSVGDPEEAPEDRISPVALRAVVLVLVGLHARMAKATQTLPKDFLAAYQPPVQAQGRGRSAKHARSRSLMPVNFDSGASARGTMDVCTDALASIVRLYFYSYFILFLLINGSDVLGRLYFRGSFGTQTISYIILFCFSSPECLSVSRSLPSCSTLNI